MPPLDSARHRENTRRAASAVGRATRPIDFSTIPGVRKGTLPASITPQLARIAPAAPSATEWLHEIKFDGYRMHVRLDRGAVRLLTRTGLDWTHKYPAIAAAVASLPARQAYLDGERAGSAPMARPLSA